MAARDLVRAVAAGLVAGFAGGLFGVGGGVILIPALTAIFRTSQHEAHGTSLAVIGATALAALPVYALHANVSWLTAAFVALGSVTTARFGARWASRMSTTALTRAFAVFLLVVATRLLWKVPAPVPHHAGLHVATIGMDLAIGAAIGVLAGFMGVGGGILAVPALALLLGFSQQLAQGTSLAVILVTAPAGAFEHARRGNLVWRWVPALAIGAAAGAPLASVIAQRLPHEQLSRGFALFLVATAVHTWLRARRRPAAAASATA